MSRWLVVRTMLLALVAGALTLGPRVAAAQAALIGTWELNVAKSKYTPGPAPKSLTVTYAAAGTGLKLSTKGVDAAGKPTGVSWTSHLDGKESVVTGSADYDAVVFTKMDASTFHGVRKKGGKDAQTAHYVVSDGGKTLTVTTNGTNAAGAKVSTTAVFEKK